METKSLGALLNQIFNIYMAAFALQYHEDTKHTEKYISKPNIYSYLNNNAQHIQNSNSDM